MQRRKQLIVLCSVGVLAWRNTVLLRGDRMGNFYSKNMAYLVLDRNHCCRRVFMADKRSNKENRR